MEGAVAVTTKWSRIYFVSFYVVGVVVVLSLVVAFVVEAYFEDAARLKSRSQSGKPDIPEDALASTQRTQRRMSQVVQANELSGCLGSDLLLCACDRELIASTLRSSYNVGTGFHEDHFKRINCCYNRKPKYSGDEVYLKTWYRSFGDLSIVHGNAATTRRRRLAKSRREAS